MMTFLRLLLLAAVLPAAAQDLPDDAGPDLAGAPVEEAPLLPIDPDTRREIEDMFPGFDEGNWGLLERGDNGAYNCYAWSVGLKDRNITSADIDPQKTPDLKAWDTFYAAYGFTRHARGHRKGADVLLYGNKKSPDHAAALSRWTLGGRPAYESKLGPKWLILHTAEALEGGSYGKVIRSYQRPRTPAKRREAPAPR